MTSYRELSRKFLEDMERHMWFGLEGDSKVCKGMDMVTYYESKITVCPFCGDDCVVVNRGTQDMGATIPGKAVRCTGCGAEGPQASVLDGIPEDRLAYEAISHWNKRVKVV